MISNRYLIDAIAETLRDDVLPHVETMAKPASDVRACLMLLAYVGDRATLEGRALSQDNLALRALLREANLLADRLALPDALRQSLTGVLAEDIGPAGYVDTAELAQAHLEYRRVLVDLTTHLSEGSMPDKAAGHLVRTRVHAWIEESSNREAAMLQSALALVPL